MKTFWFQLIGLVLVISLATFLTFNRNYLASLVSLFDSPSTTQRPQPTSNQGRTLKITAPDGGIKVQLQIEIADDKEERNKGLGFRETLATGSGMLFIHENSQKYTYWMKGMRFPIDIMWISGDTIADIIPNVLPPIEGQTDDTLERYQSTVEVDKVLETNSGFVADFNIQKGDKIILE